MISKNKNFVKLSDILTGYPVLLSTPHDGLVFLATENDEHSISGFVVYDESNNYKIGDKIKVSTYNLKRHQGEIILANEDVCKKECKLFEHEEEDGWGIEYDFEYDHY
jgi:hypothetical protein